MPKRNLCSGVVVGDQARNRRFDCPSKQQSLQVCEGRSLPARKSADRLIKITPALNGDTQTLLIQIKVPSPRNDLIYL